MVGVTRASKAHLACRNDGNDYSAIQGASFDPETPRLLGLAYERACESVAPDMTIREALAKRIIEAAKRGERNLEGLIKYGLGKNNMLADSV